MTPKVEPIVFEDIDYSDREALKKRALAALEAFAKFMEPEAKRVGLDTEEKIYAYCKEMRRSMTDEDLCEARSDYEPIAREMNTMSPEVEPIVFEDIDYSDREALYQRACDALDAFAKFMEPEAKRVGLDTEEKCYEYCKGMRRREDLY